MGTRMSISVPDDLRRRMDEVEDPSNWSATAARAFEQALGEIAARKEQKTQQDVIQRLRSSRLARGSGLGAQGREDGRRWAIEVAEAHELENLDKSRKARGTAWEAAFRISLHGRPSAALYDFITGIDEPEKSDVESFWEQVLGDDLSKSDDPDYVLAFADGALELWAEVSSQL